MRSSVNLERAAKAARPDTQSYPEICFSIHDYEDAFGDMVRLWARGGCVQGAVACSVDDSPNVKGVNACGGGDN
jgi:hypothetical protein